MAIGTTAAILGSAAIGAGASALSSSSNNRAINRATEAQTDSNAQSLALQRDIYGQNRQTLNPFVQRGNAAGDQLNALLGLGGAQPTQQQPNALSQFNGPTPFGGVGAPYGVGDYSGFDRFAGDFWQGGANNFLGGGPVPYATNPAVQTGVVQPTSEADILNQPTAQSQAEDAFQTFRDNTGYQFRVNEATDAVNSSFSGAGLFQSGAAQQALASRIGQEADSTFLNYAGLLSGQQGTGLQAAGAQAGVGVNYANSAAALGQANANAISNSAVARANNNNSFIGGIGNIAGQAIGGLAYSGGSPNALAASVNQTINQNPGIF